MTEKVKRKRMFVMRLSDEESVRFNTLADFYGLDVSAMMRMLVKRDYDFKVASVILKGSRL